MKADTICINNCVTKELVYWAFYSKKPGINLQKQAYVHNKVSNPLFLCLVLTSSISGRNACPSEVVTFTAQGTVVFWHVHGEKTMHYTSAPFTLRDEFRAEIVSYNYYNHCWNVRKHLQLCHFMCCLCMHIVCC